MYYLKTNRIILTSITLLLLIFIGLALYFSPYYLDDNPPQLDIEKVKEEIPYRGIIEFIIDSSDEQTGIKAIKVLVDEDNLEFEKELELRAKQRGETVKIDTSDYTDGQHKLFIDVVDASWWRNHKKIELEVTFDNTPPQIKLTLKPESVVQGNTLMILVRPDEPIVNIKGNVFGRTTEFYGNKPSTGTHRSLIGVSVHQEPGRHVIEVIAEDRAGNRGKTQKIVQVIKGKFEKGVVHLPKDKRQLLTDNKARKLDYAKRARAYSQFEPRQLWQGRSIIPTQGRISSSFGKQRVYNNGVRTSTHLGIDIANVTGTLVRAANSGVIALAEEIPIHGRTVIINHGQKVFSSYYHLSRIYVHKEEKVKKKQLIGEIGATGQSTGPHLHWDFQVNGVSVNPLEWTRRDFSYAED